MSEDRRAIEVVALGDDGEVERRFTINPDHREQKLDVLRGWTADAYACAYGNRPRVVNVSDWPLLPDGKPVHGVEGATFAFPAEGAR